MEHTFSNPFSEYNANVINPERIIEYWHNPFLGSQSPFNISEVFTDSNPITFMGGRGSGKTMFLRFCAHETQHLVCRQKNGPDYLFSDYVSEAGGVAAYLRIDGPHLRSFEGNHFDEKTWDRVFTHFFELMVSRSVLTALNQVLHGQIDEKCSRFYTKVSRKLFGPNHMLGGFDELIELIDDQVDNVLDFKNSIIADIAAFNPPRQLPAQTGSVSISKIFFDEFTEFKGKFQIILILDEYENFLEYQQKIVNTLIKFPKDYVTFRVGMRLMGFRTYDTISSNEFIKEGRDYRNIVLEDILIRSGGTYSGYRDFLKIVAEKRLTRVPEFRKNGFLDIINFLGNREDLESEAVDLCGKSKNSTRHFDLLKKCIPEGEYESVLKMFTHPDNPLIEMLCIVLAIRGEDPVDIIKKRDAFLQKKTSAAAKKFKLDYTDKYKLSLLILLASQYRKNKLYYSFNTVAFLSSGIIGNFIELCRRIFQQANFEDPVKLFTEGVIDASIQNEAIRACSNTEIQQLDRVYKSGSMLSNLVMNLGNVFRDYHTDTRLRYPETNQISFSKDSIVDPNIASAMKSAVEWSVLQRKPRLQSDQPGGEQTEIYTLNRMYAPAFGITYRTRGGYSESFTSDELEGLLLRRGVRGKVISRPGVISNDQAELGL